MKIKKLCFIIFILYIAFTFGITNKSYATTADSIINEAQEFIEAGKNQQGSGVLNIGAMETGVSALLQIATDIGVVVAIAVGIFLGVKIMMASSDEKAQAKQTFVAYVCGMFVTFGALYIWRFVVDLFIN